MENGKYGMQIAGIFEDFLGYYLKPGSCLMVCIKTCFETNELRPY